MSKTKKTKKTAGKENQEQVESQEVGNGDEHIPPTVVDSPEEKVFASEEQSQEVEGERTEEKPAPKPRVSKRPYIPDLEILLAAGTHTKKTMLEFIKEKYPSVSVGGADTFITDLLNIKYNHFKPRAVVRLDDGRLQFADMIPAERAVEAPGPEVVPEAEPPDETGE